MKRNVLSLSPRDSAVLFVLVGWADEYDGRTAIVGNHKYLVQGNGDDCSEMRMYVQEEDAHYYCGIGRGQLHKVRQFDVVFVAKSPKPDYRIVAVYFDVKCYPSADDDNYWWAKTSNCRVFHGSERRKVQWPGGQGMRRWAKRAAGAVGREHPNLYRDYLHLTRR